MQKICLFILFLSQVILTFPIYSEEFSLPCYKLFNSKQKYKKTLSEFKIEIEEAHKLYPGLLAAQVEIEEKVFRIDLRSPPEIKDDGGFWPNPKKRSGPVADHTINGTGTGNYVSVSSKSNLLSLLEDSATFMPRYPKQVIYSNGQEIEIDINVWKNLEKPISKNGLLFETHKHLKTAVYVIYEYKLENVEGVRVIGGSHAKELEIITRGIDISLHQECKYRKHTIIVPLYFEEWDMDRFSLHRGLSNLQVQTSAWEKIE